MSTYIKMKNLSLSLSHTHTHTNKSPFGRASKLVFSYGFFRNLPNCHKKPDDKRKMHTQSMRGSIGGGGVEY
jgi:hypothetical protein